MANKKLPGGRKAAGQVSTSAKKLVALKAGNAGVAISELPDTEKLTGKELFPVVQDNETRKVPLEELSTLISVDGINAQGGNFCLSPVAYRLANSQGSPTTFKAEYLNEAISITYRIYFSASRHSEPRNNRPVFIRLHLATVRWSSASWRGSFIYSDSGLTHTSIWKAWAVMVVRTG